MTTEKLATTNYNINKAIYDATEQYKGLYQSELSENFLEVHGADGATQIHAIRIFCMLLQNYNLDTKITSLHPFLRLNDSSQDLDAYKWNLLDPQNTNAAHRITYNGDVQALPGGLYSPGNSGDYASLNFNFFTDAIQDNYGFTVSHTGFAVGKYLTGAFDGGYLGVRGATGTSMYCGLNNIDSLVIVNNDSTIPNIITVNRIADNLSQGYNNGVLVDTGTVGGNNNVNRDYILFGLWQGSHGAPALSTIKCHVTHNGLNATDTFNLYNCIKILNTLQER
jgi:hypothetical protein